MNSAADFIFGSKAYTVSPTLMAFLTRNSTVHGYQLYGDLLEIMENVVIVPPTQHFCRQKCMLSLNYGFRLLLCPLKLFLIFFSWSLVPGQI